MCKKIFSYFLSGLIFISAAFANDAYFDNYVCRLWNSFGGLTGTTATDIIQTSDGYINIGTYEGLIRFDGVEFKTIRRARENDYNFASVRVIYEDSKGNIWLGANDEGLQKISPDGNKSYTTENGLPNNSVRAIVEDKVGNIWIGTAAGIVYLTPAGHLITPQFEAGTIHKGVLASALYCDSAGRVWLNTVNECGLFVYMDGLFRTRKELDQFGNYFITAINQDKNGDFIIAMGENGIIHVHNNKVTQVKTGTILDTIPTWTIYARPDGTIWYGTEKGMVVQSEDSYHEYETRDTVAKINKIIGDREGNIWFATDRNGIGKLNHGKFKVTKLGTTANAITEGKDGLVWVGTDNGVHCYKNESEVFNKLTEFTKGLRVRHVETALNGDILVSCYTKPAQIRYDVKTNSIKTWTTDDGLAGNKVRVAIETAPGEMYVGTTTGMSIIHSDGKISTFKRVDGLENEYVMCIYKDNSGLIWIGTDGGGIFIMKNEAIVSHISTDDGLAGNVIFKISQDKAGVFWICTGSGISRCPAFDSLHNVPVMYHNLNMEQGIGTDSVFQVLFDTVGNAWITSNYGIASAPVNEFVEASAGLLNKVNIKFYNRDDGLDSNGTTSTALCMCDSLGRLWFTMVDGIALYDPLKIEENPVKPLVRIEAVRIDNIDQKTNFVNEIVLKPGTKRVDIKFTGLCFDAPERILFRHKLTNFDTDYNPLSTGRIVSYTNLRPGKHVFLVSAINGDGFESEKAEAMTFIQKPYLHQRPWFWLLILLIFLGGVVFVFQIKQKRIKEENERLEKMVHLRTVELKHEKDKSDQLLRAILPEKTVEEFHSKGYSTPENFTDVTLLFSDIVGFTNVSSGHTAEEIVNSLNKLFCLFDERAEKFGVEKIKTIGDAYMAACGVPSPNENHAKVMIDFARGMYEDLAEYNKTAQIKFEIRIGLNCGPVNAGVIGKTKFIYDVWGNTVNVASRMETACTPGHIRVTENVRNHLLDTDINFSEPIEVNVKGKGLMTTYEVIN